MLLVTKEIERKLEKSSLGSKDGQGDNAEVIVKFFTPDSSFTWLVLEGERDGDDWLFYGLVDGLYGWEYGYFALSELKQIRGKFGLPIERDRFIGKHAKVGDFRKEW